MKEIIKELKSMNIGKVEIRGHDVEYESGLEKEILEKLKECDFVKDIKTQSLVIDYEYNGVINKYYPDFQILTKDNRLIVLEVKPIFNMFNNFVIAKYDALKKYCITNGYGYLMMGKDYKCYETINKLAINRSVVDSFAKLVREKGRLSFSQYNEFRKGYKLTTDEMYKVVLDNINILEYGTKPVFYIKYKR